MTEDDVEGLTDEEVHLLNASIVKTMLDFKRTNGEFHFALFVLTRKNDQDTEAATDLISSFSRDGVEEMLRIWLGRKVN